MIAVLANDAEHPAVSEFFELFKTPWEFYRIDSPCDVLICSDAQLRNSSAKLVLVYGGEQKTFDQENGIEILSQRSGKVLSYKGDRIPIYGNCLTFKGAGLHPLVDECTHEPAALEIASPTQTLVRVGFDLFQEIRHLLSRGQPSVHARIPALELHIALLRDLIINCSIALVEIPPVPAGFNFIACLTHDVDHVGIRSHKYDHTMFGFLYRAIIGSLINFFRGRRSVRQLAANWMAAFSLPFVHLGLAKDFWSQFDRYIEIEKGHASTFFVIPRRGDPGQDVDGRAPSMRAAHYELSEIKDQLQRVLSTGCEIGLHGIDAWRDVAKGRSELQRIRDVTGESEVGVRMHWLYFDDHSPITLERAGCSYDSTVGYNDTVGYRAGTAQVFRPLGVERMLELPMHIMDTALFFPSHMNLSPKQAKGVIDALVKNAIRFGGVLTVNWHDRSIAPERLWDTSYVSLLEDLKSKKAWFPTAAQAVSWFRKRRAAVIESVIREGEAVRIKMALSEGSDNLPGLRIRVHHPSARPTHDSRRAEREGTFVDVTFSNSAEMQIPI